MDDNFEGINEKSNEIGDDLLNSLSKRIQLVKHKTFESFKQNAIEDKKSGTVLSSSSSNQNKI